MARLTRAQQQAETRERLLSAAQELFARRGVNAVSVEQIAERAGYSRGAVYGNFAQGKPDLLAELVRRRTEAEHSELVELLRHAPGPQAAQVVRDWNAARAATLKGWFQLRLELLLHALRASPGAGDGGGPGGAAGEGPPPDVPWEALRERERFALQAHEQAVRAWFADQGLEPPADPSTLALIMHALEDGLTIQYLLRPVDVDGTAPADAVLLLLRSWAALARAGSGGAGPVAEPENGGAA